MADLFAVDQHRGELHEPSQGGMVTGHLLAKNRLEGDLEHPDLPLTTPLLADDRGLLHEGPGIPPPLHDLLQDVTQGGLLVTLEHDVAVLQTQFLQDSWLAPFSGTTLAKRYFVPNCFATRMHRGRVSAAEPKKQ